MKKENLSKIIIGIIIIAIIIIAIIVVATEAIYYLTIDKKDSKDVNNNFMNQNNSSQNINDDEYTEMLEIPENMPEEIEIGA